MSETAAIEHPTWLTSGDSTQADEPFALFAAWFGEATRAEPADPNAMALATVDAAGLPNVRMVLMKGIDENGFVFYTSRNSQKGQELMANQNAGLAFYWKSLKRQVRVRGTTEIVSDAEADAYFASRPRGAQIGAWASQQSAPLESRSAFEKAVAMTAARHAIGAVPRPPYWIGYRVVPTAIEFWHDRPFRLHDRLAFTRAKPGAPWTKTRLYP
jgi:pyridoxamine 5'-phosphate oxidase